MQSPTITMEREAALKKLEQYEEAAKANPKNMRELDRQVMQGYRVLAKGGRLVDVNEAMRHGGLNLAGQPKLAIARAHVTETNWTAGRAAVGQTIFWWERRALWNSHYSGDGYRWVTPVGTFEQGALSLKELRAMVPLIPLPHRPRHALSNYFILWEANWHPTPPVDPYLLRPITGSLMEIIAEWEVSAVELAAVRAAMRS